ncbi:hypothetical protein T492DRAFT_170660 [Pavlovales sp. CCMP2436]|nr:hypothetical protein T492DRAFT_170660 [Pavlovales sp. CCMP2436]
MVGSASSFTFLITQFLSFHLIGTNKLSPFSESTRVDTPNSLYAATKKSNEAFALVYHQGLPIQVYGHGRPRRDFTYIDDIVTGNYFCITTATTIIALHLL